MKMKAPALPKVKLPAINFQRLVEDFRTLDPKDPGLWPLGPRLVMLTGLFVGLLAVAWFLGWSSQLEDLDLKQKKEIELKEDWLNKKRQAVNLDAYRKQQDEINLAFGELLKQLPNKAEMDAMIVDISQAALSRGLKIELFKPGGEARKDFYAEVPISVLMTGSYNDLASFASDIARLPRIVTLNNVKLKPKDAKSANVLTMDATVMTYRYLDSNELAAQKKQAKPGGRK
ncbi:MAG: type 4a pilus biogenesis protein PilO [Rhodocyclaceae bacterium]|jgi:type IV pilus assembly protein PilO|nr:type 4a pilus biogenesis protein PilO [Rhodocyclaceae bacterium]